MKQTAVEWLVTELKKYDSAGLKDQSNYVIEMPTHILTELEEQAKEMEKQQGYSEEEVINFLQEMNNWPTTFEGRIDVREWFEKFKNK
jgi:hypothetical protein